MDMLLQATSDPSKGEALFHAIRQGKIRIVSNIIESGCNVNVRNESMRTPLMQAVFVQKDDVRTHIVRMLLGRGCDVNAQDDDGRTVLMLAAFEPKRDDVVRRVISTGKCDPNLKDFKGDTALVHAVYGGNASVIRILVNSSHTKSIINVNSANNDNINPLKLAFKLRQEECCRVLVEEGRAETSVIKDKESFNHILHKNNYHDTHTEVLVPEGRQRSKQMNDPFVELIASTSGYGMDTDIDPNIEDRKRTKRLRKKRSKKTSQQDDGDIDRILGVHLLSPNQSTPRSTVSFLLDPSVSRSNTLNLPNDSRLDSQTPHSTHSNYSRSKRLTPISTSFEPNHFRQRTPRPLATPDDHVRNSNTNATWWSTSDEHDHMTAAGSRENLFRDRDTKAKVRRKKKPRARLSPLHSGYRTPGHLVDDSGVTPRGSLLPAIPTTGRKVNLVGTPEFYKNMDY